MSKERKCEGSCKKHHGIVQHVFSGKSPKTGKPWDWWYCQEAIDEDKRRGLVVRDFDSGEEL